MRRAVVYAGMLAVVGLLAYAYGFNAEASRCAEEAPDGECDLAGLAGIVVAVLALAGACVALVCTEIVIRLRRRRRNRHAT